MSGQVAATVRVTLPYQLRVLAGVDGEVALPVSSPPTMAGVLDALERGYPMLVGTIRDHTTGRRRAMIRLFAAGEDLSDEPGETVLPPPVADGTQPLRIVGAIAGG